MKNIFSTIFKVFFIISLLLLAGVLIFGILLWTQWPLWVGIFFIIGIIGIFLASIFIKKSLLRKREQRFVNQILDNDSQTFKSLKKEQQNTALEMQSKWKEAIQALKKSHLKSHGNPLYVLPWYMIIGMGGSGKTTAIKSARLSSSFTDVQAISGLSGTRNCDWWFFEEAILIDTAGRYTIPVDEQRDSEEWHKFLDQLAKYRKKEPLNGLIVTVPVDSLNDMKHDELEQYGAGIRKRIDEMMSVIGARFPVYIMVTKCDLVQGMTSFCDSLDENTLKQPMGFINHDMAMKSDELVSNCFNSVGQHIRDARLLIIQKNKARDIDPELLLFPGEFEKLEPGFNALIKGIFQENPYQEAPIFRGIFFSSGRQEGTPYSHFLKDLGLIGENEVLPGTNQGLFLHDFFSKLMPADRNIFSITQQAFEWRKLTRNMGFASLFAIVIAICGLLSFSFVKNLNTLNEVVAVFSKPVIFSGETLKDVASFENFKDVISRVEEKNNNWWIPRFSLNESIEVETKLKAKYCSQFEKRFIEPLDKQMIDRMTFFSSATPKDKIMNHVIHLVVRINLIKAMLKEENTTPASDQAYLFYNIVAVDASLDIAQEVKLKLKDLYFTYLTLQNDKEVMNLRMNELQGWLKRILTLEDSDLNWLVPMINLGPENEIYSLADFWGFQNNNFQPIYVPSSFTLTGKKSIDAFINEIEQALENPLVIAGMKRNFAQLYKKEYFAAWHNFIKQFPQGKTRLKTRNNWRDAAKRIYQEDQIYFLLLKIIAKELIPFVSAENPPPWVKLVYAYNKLLPQKKFVKIKKDAKPGLLSKAVVGVKSKMDKAARAKNKLGNKINSESMLRTVKSLVLYHRALAEITPLIASRNEAFKTASLIYSEDVKISSHPFFTALDSFATLKSAMSFDSGESEEFWKIVAGPFEFYHEYMLHEASCVLQKKWEEDVLMELNDASDKKNTTSLLLGSKGFATLFVKETGKPFIERGIKKGFYPKKINKKYIPFHKSFFTFMTRGVAAAKPSKRTYNVKVTGYPTKANKSARIEPHATILALECDNETKKLENRNYLRSKTFTWSQQAPCDVVFKILIGNLTLIKKYTGHHAFPKFLRNFKNGHHKFTIEDFPEHKDALKRMNIEYIDVNYKFKGDSQVIRLLNSAPGRIPQEIVQCWE